MRAELDSYEKTMHVIQVKTMKWIWVILPLKKVQGGSNGGLRDNGIYTVQMNIVKNPWKILCKCYYTIKLYKNRYAFINVYISAHFFMPSIVWHAVTKVE